MTSKRASMATPSTMTREYPKRKRAEVSYYDGGSDEGEIEAEVELASASKVSY